MRIKSLGVFAVTAFALFIVFYWLTDEARREAVFADQQAQLVELGKEYFGPDNILHPVKITDAGFDPATITIEVNASVEFENTLDQDVNLTGIGSHPFTLAVKAGDKAASRFQAGGVTTVSGDTVSGSL